MRLQACLKLLWKAPTVGLYLKVFLYNSAWREVELEIGVLTVVGDVIDVVRHSEDEVVGDEHCAS
jgi:hypothetical protein